MAKNQKQAKKKLKQKYRQDINDVLFGKIKTNGKTIDAATNNQGDFIFAISDGTAKSYKDREIVSLYYVNQYQNFVDKDLQNERLDAACERIEGKDICLITGRAFTFKSEYRDYEVEGKTISKLAAHGICLGHPHIRKERNLNFEPLDDNHIWIFEDNCVPLNEIYSEEYLKSCKHSDPIIYSMYHYRETNKNAHICFGDEVIIACELGTYKKNDGIYKRGIVKWSPILIRMQYFDRQNQKMEDIPRTKLKDEKLKHLRIFEFDDKGNIIPGLSVDLNKTFRLAEKEFDKFNKKY